jgi:hypothetical protein
VNSATYPQRNPGGPFRRLTFPVLGNPGRGPTNVGTDWIAILDELPEGWEVFILHKDGARVPAGPAIYQDERKGRGDAAPPLPHVHGRASAPEA